MTWLWLACVAAMLIGLAIDARQTPAPLLASECGAPGTWWQLAWRHAALMPATSVAMALAALAPWPGAPSAAARALCAALMAAGMVVGARLGVGMALSAGASPFIGLVLGMAAGMAVAVLPLAALRRA
ncbi:hypothetical protein [Achromobacter sp. ESBL13]|uniref:hypothetical protein n=1 Tax=Achromobacter sp. ESBL13 TaxID=3077328 RepID=UPI002FCA779A